MVVKWSVNALGEGMNHQPILIVEDNLDLARAVTALLRRSGFNSSYALDAESAHEAMADAVPAMVILDINIPNCSGLDLLEEMRFTDRLAHVPVVVYTAIDDPALRDRARELGAVEYVVKGALDSASISRLVYKHLKSSTDTTDSTPSRIDGAVVKTLPQ